MKLTDKIKKTLAGATIGAGMLLGGMGQQAQAQQNIYVSPNGQGNGTSWEQTTNLDDALSQATPQDSVKLQLGTYTVDQQKHVNTNIQGGYSSNGELRGNPDPTITDFDSGEPVATVLQGEGENQGVLRMYGGSVQDLTITGGNAERGAGILVENPNNDVELRRLQLLQNTSDGPGSAVYISSDKDVTLTDSRIVGNQQGVGGAVHISGLGNNNVQSNTVEDNTSPNSGDFDVSFLNAENTVFKNNLLGNLTKDELERAIITQRVVGEQQYEGNAPQPDEELVATVNGIERTLNAQGDTLYTQSGGLEISRVDGSGDFIDRFSVYNETLGQEIPGEAIPTDWKGGEIPRQVDYAAGPTADNPDASPNIIIPSSEIEDLKELQVQLMPSVSPEGKNTLDTYASAVNDNQSGIYAPQEVDGEELNNMLTYISTEVLNSDNAVPDEELQKWRNAVEIISAEYPYDVEVREGNFTQIGNALRARSPDEDVQTAQNINYVYFKDQGTPSNLVRPPNEYVKSNSFANVVEGEDIINRFRNEYHESLNALDDYFGVYNVLENGEIVPNRDMNFMIQLYYATNGSL